jgi:hypothetical protein
MRESLRISPQRKREIPGDLGNRLDWPIARLLGPRVECRSPGKEKNCGQRREAKTVRAKF